MSKANQKEEEFIQYDDNVRIVSIHNLRAMCDRLSHESPVSCKYFVTKTTGNYVYVEHSNPFDTARKINLVAMFPCYKGVRGVTMVVLDIYKVLNDNEMDMGFLQFDTLIGCRTLFCDPKDDKWYTEEEIKERQGFIQYPDIPKP